MKCDIVQTLLIARHWGDGNKFHLQGYDDWPLGDNCFYWSKLSNICSTHQVIFPKHFLILATLKRSEKQSTGGRITGQNQSQCKPRMLISVNSRKSDHAQRRRVWWIFMLISSFFCGPIFATTEKTSNKLSQSTDWLTAECKSGQTVEL